MNTKNTNLSSLWIDPNNADSIKIIDQRKLPFQLEIEDIKSSDQMLVAIRDMHLRGAPLIGVAAAFGLYLGVLEAKNKSNPEEYISTTYSRLLSTRPTAVNLKFGLDLIREAINQVDNIPQKAEPALQKSIQLRQNEIDSSHRIGKLGSKLIQDLYQKKGKTINILTHCNAGWLACIEYGTATAPIYEAHNNNIPVHVWVDETRPRNQGARLTAWELQQAGVPNTIIADNAGGHLMQNGQVDMAIVGSDRTTIVGNVYNKIGTYLKALAASDNQIPFYVALPLSTIDQSENPNIEIEIRSEDEVHFMYGENEQGEYSKIKISPNDSKALNPAFDCTPSELVTALITDAGICKAKKTSIKELLDQES